MNRYGTESVYEGTLRQARESLPALEQQLSEVDRLLQFHREIGADTSADSAELRRLKSQLDRIHRALEQRGF